MEGVNIAQNRIGTVSFGKTFLKDSNKEEVSGYQKALRWIHESHNKIEITEILPNGKSRIRFKPPGVKESKIYLNKTVAIWNEASKRIKKRYCVTLKQGSNEWHESRNDKWPFINFILFVLKES